ncbi:hypothetical protein JL107_04905 [Nakamurella flavida]|uniref:Galactose oxidase n=1 Tax=Nakamurella flavida TaxID=363630 RepID=A0A938YIK7_9ACTN|nr:hypothetical protein [Nakamurella flavida]MBM9475779.1 hypothetical protein [Nakamurella flavida]MDP9777940.1 hypothetical protein [Nakamurella flavida]
MGTRSGTGVALLATTLLLLGAAGCGDSAARDGVSSAASSTAGPPPASPPGSGDHDEPPPRGPAPSGSALDRATWSELPEAPIAGRRSAAAAWTGTEMLVWGGTADFQQSFADGAAYDPAARTWRTLPASPLSARVPGTSLWTGNAFFVWGGTPDGDGALYDPRSNSWTAVPGLPAGPTADAVSVWTGSEILLFPYDPGDGTRTTGVQGWAWVPGQTRWTALPELVLPTGHPALKLTAVMAGDVLYLWSAWSRTDDTSASTPGRMSSTTVSGIDTFRFSSVGAPGWAAAPEVMGTRDGLDSVIWTGQELVLTAAPEWLPRSAGPPRPSRPGRRYTPANGAGGAVAVGPLDDTTTQQLWAGDRLIAVDAPGWWRILSGTPAPAAGSAAAWDPATDSWTPLATAPSSSSGHGVAAVWTGTSLVLWGLLTSDPPSAQCIRFHGAGLQLAAG